MQRKHRVARPRTTPPRAAEPRAAEPRAAQPRAAQPRAAQPRAAEPRATYAPELRPLPEPKRQPLPPPHAPKEVLVLPEPTDARLSEVWESMLAACEAPLEHVAPGPQPGAVAPPGVCVGTLVAIAPQLVVRFDEAPDGVVARSTVPLCAALVGCEVTLSFERGRLDRPIVTGVMQAPVPLEAEADGQAMVVRGHDRIVLRCGKASITLTKSGKVLLKGAYVSSHSTGMHRIKGGSVQIN